MISVNFKWKIYLFLTLSDTIYSLWLCSSKSGQSSIFGTICSKVSSPLISKQFLLWLRMMTISLNVWLSTSITLISSRLRLLWRSTSSSSSWLFWSKVGFLLLCLRFPLEDPSFCDLITLLGAHSSLSTILAFSTMVENSLMDIEATTRLTHVLYPLPVFYISRLKGVLRVKSN